MEVHCKKGYCVDKNVCERNVYTEQLEEGEKAAEGKGPLELSGFSGTPPFPASLLVSDFTALNQLS